MKPSLVAFGALVTLACAVPTSGDGAPAPAPLLGSADGTDAADRGCHVVLRTAGRARTEDGRPDVETIDGLGWLRFEVVFDVSAEAVSDGAIPAVLYRDPSSGEWHEASAETWGAAPTGFVRHRARFAEHTVRDGISTTALSRVELELVPFLHAPAGGRLFDHNVFVGDLDNYRLAGGAGFAYASPEAACSGASADATLTFDAEWNESASGVLSAGGTVAIDYALERLAQCHGDTYMGRRTWDTLAFVRALPSGDVRQVSVVACDDARCDTPRPARSIVSIPEGTSALELWFSTSGRSCGVHYDSGFGANYRFAVTQPVDWVGGFVSKISRAGGAPCDGAGDMGDSVGYDTWGRTRSITANFCFRVWSDGITDWSNPELASAVSAHVSCVWDGTEVPRAHGASFDAFVGNDARYRVDLRNLDPFQRYRCPDVPTVLADGYEVAGATCSVVANGASWGPAGEGDTFRVHFADYPDAWRDANCPR